MQIRPIHPTEVEAARQLLHAKGWVQRAAGAARFAEWVRRSQVALERREGVSGCSPLRAASLAAAHGRQGTPAQLK